MKKLAFLALILLAPLALHAGDRSSDPFDAGANVMITVTVTDETQAGDSLERSVQTLALDGKRSHLTAGWRLPIPTSTLPVAAGDGGALVSSYQYQDVGVRTSLEARIVARNRIRVAGEVELSAVDQSGSTDSARPPRLGTFSHRFDIVLVDGQDTLIAEVPKPDGGSIRLEVRAGIRE